MIIEQPTDGWISAGELVGRKLSMDAIKNGDVVVVRGTLLDLDVLKQLDFGAVREVQIVVPLLVPPEIIRADDVSNEADEAEPDPTDIPG